MTLKGLNILMCISQVTRTSDELVPGSRFLRFLSTQRVHWSGYIVILSFCPLLFLQVEFEEPHFVYPVNVYEVLFSSKSTLGHRSLQNQSSDSVCWVLVVMFLHSHGVLTLTAVIMCEWRNVQRVGVSRINNCWRLFAGSWLILTFCPFWEWNWTWRFDIWKGHSSWKETRLCRSSSLSLLAKAPAPSIPLMRGGLGIPLCCSSPSAQFTAICPSQWLLTSRSKSPLYSVDPGHLHDFQCTIRYNHTLKPWTNLRRRSVESVKSKVIWHTSSVVLQRRLLKSLERETYRQGHICRSSERSVSHNVKRSVMSTFQMSYNSDTTPSVGNFRCLSSMMEAPSKILLGFNWDLLTRERLNT